MSRHALIFVLIAISAAWLAMVSLLAHCFNVPSADGILYSLPFATAKHPFDLGVPFLDDFDGYGSSWGHQWPGTMWLRGLVFLVVPYSRLADVAVLSCFQLLAAFTAASLVWRFTCRLLPSLATLAVLLSDRLLLLSCAGNRIEAPAVAATLLLFAATVRLKGQATGRWQWIGAVAAFFCASGHPYSMLLGGLILALDFLPVRSGGRMAFREWIPLACGFILGFVSTATWFTADHAAWHQFVVNMGLQKSFYRNWDAVWSGLGNYRLQAGAILWGAGMIAGLLAIVRFLRCESRQAKAHEERPLIHAAILLFSIIIIHTITRCENFCYLAFGSPFAAILAFVLFSRIRERVPASLIWLPPCAMAIVALPHAILLPHRTLQYLKAGRPDFHSTYAAILRSIPENRTIYISHALWPAAVEDKTHSIRWFTFPIASKRDSRRRYEDLAYCHARPGDILILDQDTAGHPDRFGLHPTFNTNPPDPAKWRPLRFHKQIFPGAIPWGINLSLFERLP